MEKIVNLDIMMLHEHPDNPRADVGDVTELADSIRAMGIMQNLTVIPSSEVRNGAGSGYTVVIGHRRLAAAKEAGLPDVPCVITHMTRDEQLATMISENMHRADLSIPEQVHGIQLMFDLGADEETVAKKTGLSVKTVRQRAKLAGLPEEEFRTAHENGGTLDDYIKITQIKSPKKQKELLKKVGTDNYRISITGALNEQITAEKLKLIKKKLKELGIPKDENNSKRWSSQYDTVLGVDIKDYDPEDKKHPLNTLVAGDKDFWVEVFGYCYVLKPAKKKKAVKPKKSKKEIEADECRALLRQKLKLCFETRKTFVEEFSDWEKYGEIIDNEFLIRMVDFYVTNRSSYQANRLKSYVGYEGYPGEDERIQHIKRFCGDERRAKLLVMWHMLDDSDSLSPAFEGYGENKPRPGTGYCLEKWKKVYEFLSLIGYKMSSEEKALEDGTSEVYGK